MSEATSNASRYAARASSLGTLEAQGAYIKIAERIMNGEEVSDAELLSWDDHLPNHFRRHARTLCTAALIHSDLDHLDAAETAAQRARRLARAAGDREIANEASLAIAETARRRGRLDEAERIMQEAVRALGSAASFPRPLAIALDSLGHLELARGSPEGAAERWRRAVGLAVVDLQDEVLEAILRGNLAKALYRRGLLREATDENRVTLAGLIGRHPRCVSYAKRVAGDVLVEQMRRDDARAAYREALEVASLIGNQHCADMAMVGLARWEVVFGKPEGALQVLISTERVGESHQDGFLQTELIAVRALAQARASDPAAWGTMDAALARMEGMPGNLYVEGWVRASRSALLLRDGAATEAEAEARLADAALCRVAPVLLGLPHRLASALA